MVHSAINLADVGIQELVEYLKQDYQNVRVLEDGTIIGTCELIFTRALCIGLNRYSWEKRFCFENREAALIEMGKLVTGDDEPTPGTYIARR